jgi:hypothetical protein
MVSRSEFAVAFGSCRFACLLAETGSRNANAELMNTVGKREYIHGELDISISH